MYARTAPRTLKSLIQTLPAPSCISFTTFHTAALTQRIFITTIPSPTPPSGALKDKELGSISINPPCEWVEDYRPGGYHPVLLGDVFNNGQYKVIRKLGEGSSSTVWLARDLR